MPNCSFWLHLLNTIQNSFQFSPNWVKPLWLILPPIFLLCVLGNFLQYRLMKQQKKSREKECRVYHALQDPQGKIYLRGKQGAPLDGRITLIPVPIQSDLSGVLEKVASSDKTEEEE